MNVLESSDRRLFLSLLLLLLVLRARISRRRSSCIDLATTCPTTTD